MNEVELARGLIALLTPLIDERVKHALEQLEENEPRRSRWATLEEAAEHLRTTPGAMRKRAARGRLPGAVKDGRRWLVDLQALDSSQLRRSVVGDQVEMGERRSNGLARGTRRHP